MAPSRCVILYKEYPIWQDTDRIFERNMMARQLSGPTNPKGGLLNLIRPRAARDWQLYVLLLPLLV